MMERLVQERIGSAVNNIAPARGVLDETIEYVKDRTAFGTAIGSFQHNKFRIAELVTPVDVTQAFVDQCVMAHVHGQLNAVDAAKAKWWSAEVQNQVTDACVQLYGGYGFMNEYRVARAWRDARVTKIWAGSSRIGSTHSGLVCRGLRRQLQTPDWSNSHRTEKKGLVDQRGGRFGHHHGRAERCFRQGNGCYRGQQNRVFGGLYRCFGYCPDRHYHN
jgi:hypothetical protein